MEKRLRRRLLRLALLVKLLDGASELAGAVLLFVLRRPVLNRLLAALTQHELAEDPRDFVANHLTAAVHRLTPETRRFAAVYLLAHGAAKVVLMVGLLRGCRSFYPWTIGFLVLFIGYQFYRISYSHSPLLAVFTAVDIFVVALIWREYAGGAAGLPSRP
jgi:uncharacterized membrane protein